MTLRSTSLWIVPLLATIAIGCADEQTTSETSEGDEAIANISQAVTKPGEVDLSRLDPPLHYGKDPAHPTWKWRCVNTQQGPLCFGEGVNYYPANDLLEEWWNCDGASMYSSFTEGGTSIRQYNTDYKVVKKVSHLTNDEYISLNSDGSGKRIHVSGDYVLITDYAIPADDGSTTITHLGTDAYAEAMQGPRPREVFVQRGKLIEYPDKDPQFWGRWDLFTDFEGAVSRMCARLK